MEKERKILSKIQKILIVLFSVSAVLILTIFSEIGVGDELWTFQNSSKLYNGYLIYKDANVITTPLFFYIATGLFKMFGWSFFVYRIYNVLIYSVMMIFIYKIFRNLKISKHIAVLGISVIFLEIASLYTTGANYNILAVVFVIIGVNLYAGRNQNTILHGIVMTLVFLTKQNIGIYYIMAEIACDLYLKGFNKDFFVCLIKKILVFFSLMLIVILKLYFDGLFYDFINYAFGSLIEFGTENQTFVADFKYLFLFCFPFVCYAFVFISVKIKKDKIIENLFPKEKYENVTILIIFTFFTSLLIFPLANIAHFLIALPIHLIFIVYFLNVAMINDMLGEKKYSYVTNSLIIIMMLGINISGISHYLELKDDYTFVLDKSSIFYGFMISDKNIEKKEVMKKYITEKNNEGIDVIVFSCDSGLYMVELKQSHGVYDLLFYGNMGYNGEERVKEDILNRTNTEFLIPTNDDDVFAQESQEIRNFIIENLTYEGTIENYSIYKTE